MKTSKQKLNRFEICLSGLGGQGILTLGKIMGGALALGHGYYVTQTQSYGPEARGGASRSDLVISSQPISYPKTDKIDLLVALSQEACNQYFHLLKPRSVLLVDESLVKQAPTNMYLALPFTPMAKEKVGVPQAMNTVVLGALTFLLPFAKRATMRESLKSALPPKLHEVNMKAFTLGYGEAKKKFKESPPIWSPDAPPLTDDEDEELAVAAILADTPRKMAPQKKATPKKAATKKTAAKKPTVGKKAAPKK